MKALSLIVCVSAVLIAAGCGDSDSTSNPSTTSAISSAVTLAANKMDKAVPSTSSVSFLSTDISPMAALTANYTDSDKAISLGDFGQSPRGFLLKHGNDTAQSSLMYRFKQNVEQNICLFSYFLPTTGGVPTITSSPQTVTIPTMSGTAASSLTSACPSVDTSEVPGGTVIRYHVEDISSNSGTKYERKISFDLGNDGTFESFFYYTITSTLTKMAFVEDSSNDSIALFQYDSSTGQAQFEFTEDASGSNFKAFYRAALDETNNQARYLAKVVDTSGPHTSSLVVTLSTQTSTEMSISYSFDDNADTHDLTDGNACISNTSYNILSDNTLSCQSGAVTGAAASTFTTDFTRITGANILAFDETMEIKFSTLANMLSSAVAY